MIDFHFCPTPNGWKVAIFLAETNLPHRVVPYDIFQGHHLTAEFRRINPNCKLPAIVDRQPSDGGAPVSVFESGAILIYLAEKTGAYLPTAFRQRTVVLQWLAWQIASVGPMGGQASHFMRYAPQGQDYAIARYKNEVRRLYTVLERRLETVEYVAGDYSIADMALWPWTGGGLVGIDLEEFPQISRWRQLVGDRPAVKQVFENPETAVNPKYVQPDMVLTEDEWSNTFGQRMLQAPGAAG